MAQRFIVMKYKSILPTCMIPEPGDPMGADSYAYTSLKYTYTSLKYAGVVAEPSNGMLFHPLNGMCLSVHFLFLFVGTDTESV